jgi:hypothetical protein
MNIKMYAVPGAIASELNLTDYRQTDGKGNYLLSQRDLRCYGIEKALEEGAVELTADKAKIMFNL